MPGWFHARAPLLLRLLLGLLLVSDNAQAPKLVHHADDINEKKCRHMDKAFAAGIVSRHPDSVAPGRDEATTLEELIYDPANLFARDATGSRDSPA